MISQLPRHRGFLTGEMRVIYKHTDTNKFCIMKEIKSLRKAFLSSFNFTPGPSETGPKPPWTEMTEKRCGLPGLF